MKKNLIIGILLGFFATFLMSHNVSAASLNLNNLDGYTTTLSGIGGNIRFQSVYPFTGSGNYLYINGGTFQDYSVNWLYGHKYQIILIASVDATGVDFIIPNAISVSGDNYHTEKDTIESSVSCASSCKYTVIHTIDIIADNSGSELVKISKSNILNIRSSSGSVNGKFNLTTIIFDNVDEAMAFRSNLMNKLNDINSDTSDIVDTLGEINDKLNKLDTNADKNAEAWNNMQNTDGLIDVGDNTSFMDTFNSINSFFGGMKNVSATDCSFDFSNDVVDLGTLNFCSMPEALRNIISPIAAIIFSVVDIFLAWGSIKYIVSIIDWARRN